VGETDEVLRASRVGLLSTRYDITCDGTSICTWKPSRFIGGGAFELDGRRYDVARGGWTGRRYRLRDESGTILAVADGVGRVAWTLETEGVTHAFERPSPVRRDQVLMRDGEPVGMVRPTSAWWGEAEADLPGLPLAVQIFVLVSLLSVWDED
jgi:hypothetical protein